MDLTLPWLMAAGFLIFCGALVQSAIGFGLAVVASPLLYLIEPRLVPGPLLLLLLLLSLANMWKYRSDLALLELGSAVVGRVPGLLAALWLLTLSPGRALPLLIGIAVLATIAISLTRIQFYPTPMRLFLAGMASGFMGTATAIGGPAMALVYQHSSPDRIRANLAAYFAIGCFMSLVGLTTIGRFGYEHFVLSVWFALPTFAGFLAGGYVVRWLGTTFIRPSILLLCALAALGVLIDGIWGY